jgi:hypothetical protein
MIQILIDLIVTLIKSAMLFHTYMYYMIHDGIVLLKGVISGQNVIQLQIVVCIITFGGIYKP